MRELSLKIVESSRLDVGLIGGISIAFWIQGLTVLTAVGGLLLISLRIAIALQEYRYNQAFKFKIPASTETDDEPGA